MSINEIQDELIEEFSLLVTDGKYDEHIVQIAKELPPRKGINRMTTHKRLPPKYMSHADFRNGR